VSDRFYCPGPWSDGRAVLVGDEARHLARVRRVGVGARVALFDGRGRSATAEVVEVGRDRVGLTILSEGPAGRALAGPLVLATAVPKGERFDWLVEKATELGVSRLVPILAERSSVDPRGTKLDRLRRLVVEASKQSGRCRLMDIDEPTPLADWLGSGGEGLGSRYIAHPGASSIGAYPRPDLAGGIVVAVGPEGGFTDDEVDRATRSGYRTIGLGPTTLRVETAAVATCAAVLAGADAGSNPIGSRRDPV